MTTMNRGARTANPAPLNTTIPNTDLNGVPAFFQDTFARRLAAITSPELLAQIVAERARDPRKALSEPLQRAVGSAWIRSAQC